MFAKNREGGSCFYSDLLLDDRQASGETELLSGEEGETFRGALNTRAQQYRDVWDIVEESSKTQWQYNPPSLFFKSQYAGEGGSCRRRYADFR